LVLSVNLHNLESLEQYQQAITDYAQDNPDAPIIRGSGWSNTLFPADGPRKDILDALVPGRPACLKSEDGHSCWVNSFALAAAGIHRDTPAPEGGIIERDDITGEPSGTLRESAMDLMNELVPEFTIDQWRQGLLAYQEMAAACGVTGAMESMADRALGGYRSLAADALLTVRFRGSLLVKPTATPADVPSLAEERAKNTHPLFQTGSA
jgi:predicted amidohydrolase YtcJ